MCVVHQVAAALVGLVLGAGKPVGLLWAVWQHLPACLCACCLPVCQVASCGLPLQCRTATHHSQAATCQNFTVAQRICTAHACSSIQPGTTLPRFNPMSHGGMRWLCSKTPRGA